MDCVSAFRDALQASYGPLDWLPVADGTIRRFHVPGDKAGTLNGWYVLHLDGIASGAFGSWKAGTSHTWSSREPANPLEAEQVRQRIEQARRQREAEQHQRQQAAAEYAARLWRDALQVAQVAIGVQRHQQNVTALAEAMRGYALAGQVGVFGGSRSGLAP